MEIIIKINGQALPVEVSVEVYTYLDQADHKDENLAHEQRRHWDINGLDPVAIKDIRGLFISLKKGGTTIILSSHILSEILQTAENIVILSNGNLQQLGAIDMIY